MTADFLKVGQWLCTPLNGFLIDAALLEMVDDFGIQFQRLAMVRDLITYLYLPVLFDHWTNFQYLVFANIVT